VVTIYTTSVPEALHFAHRYLCFWWS